MINPLAYVIRLKDIESSELLANECFVSCKKNGLPLRKFNGIYGEKNIEMTQNMYNIRPWKSKMKKGRIGVKGCFLSHYTLWQSCIRLNQPIIIFEQDAVMLRPLRLSILDEFEEFLILDPYNKMKPDYQHFHETEKRTGIEEYFNNESIAKYGVVDQYAMGLQAYIIKPSAALKLTDYVQKNGYLPADLQCNKGILNMQTIYPAVAAINPKYWGKKGLMREESTTQKKWQNI